MAGGGNKDPARFHPVLSGNKDVINGQPTGGIIAEFHLIGNPLPGQILAVGKCKGQVIGKWISTEDNVIGAFAGFPCLHYTN